MLEKRQYGRFPFPFTVRLVTLTTNGKEVLDVVTKDISASGTFIPTQTTFPEGTKFILYFTSPDSNNKKHNHLKRLKCFIGRLVRLTRHGIAIQFNRECQIESLKALPKQNIFTSSSPYYLN